MDLNMISQLNLNKIKDVKKMDIYIE